MVKVKNKGTNPLYIGSKICPGGDRVSEVKENDLSAFLKTPGGASLHNLTLFIFDDDFEKQQSAEKIALKAAAIAEAKKEIGPELMKEAEKKVSEKYEKKISDLEKKIETKSTLVDPDPAPPKETSGDEVEDSDEPEAFVFDPEKHLIEHRGGGKWYVMDGKDKVHGPISKKQKVELESMIGE